MSRLPLCSARQMFRILRHLGFQLARHEGGHAVWVHADGRLTVIPAHPGEMLGRGLLRRILREIGLSVQDYIRFR